MAKQPAGIKEGIYFNLSNEDYHKDPALSHSGMKDILVSWPDYWVNSCLNPNRKAFKQTEAMKFGERSGMLLLQPSLFHKKFNTYGKGAGSDAKAVWISSTEYTELSDSITAVMETEDGKNHFSDGYPEVAIFWRDPATGIMLRAKIDWLRTFGAIDFKRIKEVNSITIGRAVRDQALDIQAFHYLDGIKAARSMLTRMEDAALVSLAKKEGVDPEWLRAFRDEADLLFRFLFQRSTAPYIWEFRQLDNEVLTEGANATFKAINTYRNCLEKYGLGRPPYGGGKLKTIHPHHVPRRSYDYETDEE